MTGRLRAVATLPAAIALALVACAPAVQPQPADPALAQITVLQKQLLELQNLQNEDRRKVQEQAAVTESLSSKIKALEERQSLAPASLSAPTPRQITSTPSSPQKVAPEKKKTVQKKKKKKKTVRRQEQ